MSTTLGVFNKKVSAEAEPTHVHLCWSRNGTTRIYFYRLWFLGHFCLVWLQVEFSKNCSRSNIPTSPEWAWRSYPPPAWNIHTAAESETCHVTNGGGRSVARGSLRAFWKPPQCVMKSYKVCVNTSRPLWLGSVFGLGQLWKLGSTLPAVTKRL